MSLPLHRPPSDHAAAALALRYLATAAAAYVLAALAVVWLAPELSGHYYQPRLFALTHLVTLGWITLSIMGASYQIVPIALGRPLWSERLARWQFWILVTGIAGMVSHFYLGTWPGLAAAAALVGSGVALHVFNVAMTLRGLRDSTFTARAVRLGHAGLALTALFGLTLSANRLWPVLPGDALATLHAHVHLALLGWVAPMVFGVAARIYPMFLVAPEPAPWLGRVQLWGLGLGLPVLIAGLIAAPALTAPGALAVSAAVAAHGVAVLTMARASRRPGFDGGLRLALTGSAVLVPLIAGGLGFAFGLLSGPRAALAYGALALGGWSSLTIGGVMLKIVPVLVWRRVYGPRVGRVPVPSVAQLTAPRLEALAYALLTAGMLLLAVTFAAGDARWIRGAGVLLVLGGLALATALAHALRHLAVVTSSMPVTRPRTGDHHDCPGPDDRRRDLGTSLHAHARGAQPHGEAADPAPARDRARR